MREQKGLDKQLSDTVGAFLDDEKVIEYRSIFWTSCNDLYNAYKSYVDNINGIIESIRVFNTRLRLISNIARDRKRVDGKAVRGWKGIRVIIKQKDEVQ